MSAPSQTVPPNSPAAPDPEKAAALAAMEKLASAAKSVAHDHAAAQSRADVGAWRRLTTRLFRMSTLEAIAAASAVLLAAVFGFMFGPRFVEAPAPAPKTLVLDSIAPWKPQVAQAPAMVDALAQRLTETTARLERQIGALRQETGVLKREMADAAHRTPTRAAVGENLAALERQVARIDRLERLMADQTPIGAHVEGATRAYRGTPSPPGYVLRRVVDGVATVQSSNGLTKVAVGDLLPGAGEVRAIERRDGRWLVFTRQGVID